MPQFHLLTEQMQKRTFFKYEKRVRDLSTHEKVFAYFSSASSAGASQLSPFDLVRALLAIYPPDGGSWARSGSLAGERSFRTAPPADTVRYTFIICFIYLDMC